VALLAITSASWAQTDGVRPPSTNSVRTSLPQADREITLRKQQEFVAFDPQYQEKLAERIARARMLGKQVIQREVASQNTEFSHQIVSEIIWLVSSTADFKRMDQRLDDLQTSLDHPEREAEAKEQDPGDGSWGKGCTEWFFKVVASYGHLQTPSKKKGKPEFEFHFLDRIKSPEKLTDYLLSVSVSDIARTGVDHERELNESLSNLMRMIIRGRPPAYAYDPKLKAALMDLILHRLRNPATGFWGERYVHDGRVEFVDDLSITFHVVSYLDGDVPDMNKVVATTLAIKDNEFPAGWRRKGQYWDHLNVDVAELFRLGWQHATSEQKQAIAVELNKLLNWCLTESLQPDGSFKFVEGDNSKEEGTYYGASFLSRVGYFDKSKRFWTARDFPEAEEVCQRIISYIDKHVKSGATGGDYYESVLKELHHTAAPTDAHE